jgi:hypothetical protein
MRIEVIKACYPELKLTKEQAICIYDLTSTLKEACFSEWEKLDYEYFLYSKVLNSEQLLVFNRIYETNKEAIESGLISSDASDDELHYYRERRKLYEREFNNVFLSGIFQDRLPHLDVEQQKLKEEYSNFLRVRHSEILAEHFRFSRTFQRKRLEVSLLNHSVNYLFPDVENFMEWKCTEDLEVLQNTLSEYSFFDLSIIRNAFCKINEEGEVLLEKFIGGKPVYYFESPQQFVKDEEDYYKLTIVLMDRKRYGLNY